MNKQYQHNGKTYELKPITLGVMKNVLQLIAALRKMQHNYTRDIDMSDVNNERIRLKEFETAKKQLNERLREEIIEAQRSSVMGKIGNLNEKISACKTEFELNESFKRKLQLYNECSSLALFEALSEKQLIKPAIEEILTCADHPIGIVEGIDFDDISSFRFITEVLTDFFLLIHQSNLKSER